MSDVRKQGARQIAHLREISPWCWEIPQTGEMRVPGRVFSDSEFVTRAGQENALEQVANVACLPGIEMASMAMPDIHWGYGFAIGGVAAFRLKDGIISPGGVGYDIACGVRLIRSNLVASEMEKAVPGLVHELSRSVPAGVGRHGDVRLGHRELDSLMTKGVPWLISQGYGWPDDIEAIEDGGVLDGANPELISPRARERGFAQSGTLGAGNHFLEVQRVEQIFDEAAAWAFGIFSGQLCIMVHSGSRGLGHQVCTEYVKTMGSAAARAGINLPDRQLACAPINSPEGRDYYAAMACAVNFARGNRQVMTHLVRQSCEHIFKSSAEKLGLDLVYDVSHNVAKFEEHETPGGRKILCIHRKGATRSFPAGHAGIPEKYRAVGQPVIVPGDMGTASYLLKGTSTAMAQSFGSTCHGAGRVMGRRAAKRAIQGHELKARLEAQGITISAGRTSTLAEEAPEAYKDIDKVVEVCHQAGLSKKVARLRPMGVVKG
ncbi:MAG: RtcB family protein [Actinobacteria bacterium]|nr:RtcB family protein [Actinomycetota bacterium]MCL5882453.1 RtcB family protein [Actinomycetota bacterium]